MGLDVWPIINGLYDLAIPRIITDWQCKAESLGAEPSFGLPREWVNGPKKGIVGNARIYNDYKDARKHWALIL